MARTRPFFLPFISLFSFIIIFTACQPEVLCNDPLGCIPVPPGAPLEIGIDKSTTGNALDVSQSILAALNFMAAKTPGFDGHPIHIYFQESPCNPQPHLQAASGLSALPDLVAIIGPVCQAESGRFAKLISDNGQLLLSPGLLLDTQNQPGWFRIYPTMDQLAGAAEKQLSSHFQNQAISVLVENQEVDLNFSSRLCEAYKANRLDCTIISTFEKAADDPAIFSSIHNSPLLVIVPFGEIADIPGFLDLKTASNLIFFDPELAPIPQDLPAALQNDYFITFRQSQNAGSFLSALPSAFPTINALFTYDSIQLLLKALAASSQVYPDGSLLVPRQGLRDALQHINSYDGILAHYNCQSGNTCIDPENLLTMIQPNRKSNP